MAASAQDFAAVLKLELEALERRLLAAHETAGKTAQRDVSATYLEDVLDHPAGASSEHPLVGPVASPPSGVGSKVAPPAPSPMQLKQLLPGMAEGESSSRSAWGAGKASAGSPRGQPVFQQLEDAAPSFQIQVRTGLPVSPGGGQKKPAELSIEQENVVDLFGGRSACDDAGCLQPQQPRSSTISKSASRVSFAGGLLASIASEHANDDDTDPASNREDPPVGYQIHPAWSIERNASVLSRGPSRQTRMMGHRPALLHSTTSQWAIQALGGTFGEDGSMELCCFDVDFKAFVLRPNSPIRVLLDFCGLALISYDVIWTPLQAFDPDAGTVSVVMAWLARLFWTLDFLMSFVSARVNADGLLESTPRQILGRYARTWMLFDLTLLCLEWIQVASEGSLRSTAGALRALRLFRMVRLLRVAKLIAHAPDILRLVECRVRSEAIVLVLNIIKIAIVILLITHAIACVWYSTGIKDGVAVPGGWAELAGLDTLSMGDCYAVSFHWSLTQLTGGNSDIVPIRAEEYVVAIVVVAFTFVIAAVFVSSLTTSMTRLQLLNTHHSRQLATLNRYLSNHSISSELMTRVLRNAKFALDEERKNVPESSVELLQYLSKPVRVELDYEVFAPSLLSHPFFGFYKRMNLPGLRQVCNSAVSQLAVAKDDVLFHDGEIPTEPRMFFLTRGTLTYRRTSMPTQVIEPGRWACEAFLWVKAWSCHGYATAMLGCAFLCVNAKAFQKVASQYKALEFWPAMYAAEYLEQINKIELNNVTEFNDAEVLDPSAIIERINPESEHMSHTSSNGGRRFSLGSTGSSHRGSAVARRESTGSYRTSRGSRNSQGSILPSA